ncbi:MAG TPA: hypothetical protein VGC41_11250, partial [Kofleriaceae bacterium]
MTDRELTAMLRELHVPPLGADRRRAIKAETMAVLDAPTARVTGTRRILIAGFAIAAAVIAWLGTRQPQPSPPELAIAVHEETSPVIRAVAREDGVPVAPVAPPAAIPDAVTLADGTLELDTRGKHAVEIVIGETLVRAAQARVRVQARNRAVVSVEVVVGAVHIVTRDRDTIVERGMTWEPPVAAGGLSEFRAAWVELRAGHSREAMLLFDRATNPAIREEARYWAAIAASRARDPSAAQRMVEFEAAFPDSPYAKH